MLSHGRWARARVRQYQRRAELLVWSGPETASNVPTDLQRAAIRPLTCGEAQRTRPRPCIVRRPRNTSLGIRVISLHTGRDLR